MVCRACGRTIANEDANFCEYCGTATNVNRGNIYIIIKKEMAMTNRVARAQFFRVVLAVWPNAQIIRTAR